MASKNTDKQRIKEAILVRGIAAAIASMSYPSLKNLKELIRVSFEE